MESESAGKLFAQLRPMIEGLIDQKIQQLIFNKIGFIESNVAQSEARIVLCEQAQKNLHSQQQQLADSAQEAVESLKGLEEMIADEVGRAQDLAKQAMERAEDSGNHTIIHMEDEKPKWTVNEFPELDKPIWGDQQYTYGIKQTPYLPQQPTLKQIISKLNIPDKPCTPPLMTLDEQQFQSLYSSLPNGDQAATKIDALMAQKSKRVEDLRIENNPDGSGHCALKVHASSQERSLTMNYDPNTNQWMLGEIFEHPQPKLKKKRSKKNANSISE